MPLNVLAAADQFCSSRWGDFRGKGLQPGLFGADPQPWARCRPLMAGGLGKAACRTFFRPRGGKTRRCALEYGRSVLLQPRVADARDFGMLSPENGRGCGGVGDSWVFLYTLLNYRCSYDEGLTSDLDGCVLWNVR